MTNDEIRARLEHLRGQLRAERISWGELHELQSLAEHIEPGDVELLEAAGVPEFPDSDEDKTYVVAIVVPVTGPNPIDAWEDFTSSDACPNEALFVSNPMLIEQREIDSPDFDVYVKHGDRWLTITSSFEETRDDDTFDARTPFN